MNTVILFPLALLATVSAEVTLRAQLHPSKLPYPMEDLSPMYDGADKVYMIGGDVELNGTHRINKFVTIFDLQTEKFTVAAELPKGLDKGSSILLGNGSVLYFGGISYADYVTREIFRFDHPNVVTDWNRTFYYSQRYLATNKIGDKIYFVDNNLRYFDVSKEFFGIERIGNFPYSYTSTAIGNTIYMPNIDIEYKKNLPASDQTDILLKGFVTYDVVEKRQGFIPVPLPDRGYYVFNIAGSDDLGNIIVVDFKSVVLRYNVRNSTLESFVVEGLSEIPRGHNSAVYIPKQKRIYIFGGDHVTSPATQMSNELWFIDLP